jgi:membrane-associated phospholipid phosphatase
MAPSAEPVTRPSFYSRWLSAEGYLGLHLVAGFLVAVLAGWIFGGIADWVFDSPTTRAADHWAQRVAAAWISPGLTAFMRFASSVGKPQIVALISLTVMGVLLWARSHRRLYAFAATMIGGTLLNPALKLVFHRDRPSGFAALGHAAGYSFPSGHAMGATLLFGSLAYVIYFSIDHSLRLRVLAVTLCALMILSIGASRVYLGVHYLSDVLAGFAAGLCWVGVCLSGTEAWVRWRDWRRKRAAAARKAVETRAS